MGWAAACTGRALLLGLARTVWLSITRRPKLVMATYSKAMARIDSVRGKK
jgi:hypothetical protein